MTKERKRTRFVWWATLTSMVILNLVLAGVLIRHVSTLDDGPYDPFGDFPPQAAPTQVVVGETVPVEVVKCYIEDVQVVGTISWRSLSPSDAVFPVGTGVNEALEGCNEFSYINPWPPSAVSQANAWLANGEEVVFRIEGIETPAKGGVSKLWQTTPFEVLLGVGDSE